MVAATVTAVLAAPAGAAAGNGVISGTVVDEDAYEPIPNARVATSRTRGGLDIETRTGADGKYVIGGLDDGTYDIAFLPPEATNYVMEWYSDASEWGSSNSVVIKDGAAVTDVDGSLMMGSTLTGRVTTKSGPAAKACVNALALDRSAASIRSAAQATTDAAGNYKLGNLPPGFVKLWAGPVEGTYGGCEGGARGTELNETWLGGSDFFSATPVRLGSEEDRRDVDIELGGGTRSTSPAPPAQGAGCVVPKLRSLGLAGARKALTAANCKLGKTTRRTDGKVKRGNVISSKPKAGTSLPAGSKVGLVVSRGPARKR